MYFALFFAAALYSIRFLFSRTYQRHNGTGLIFSLIFSAAFSVPMALIGLALVAFRPSVTPFAALVAAAFGAVHVACAACEILALSRVSLAKFSVFMMLGGMALPAAFGIVFYSERLSAWKIVCLCLIVVSLFLNWERGSSGKGAIPIFAAIFVLNGMFGVLSKLHQSSELCVDSFSFMALCAAFTGVFSAVGVAVLAIAKRQLPKISRKSYFLPVGYAVCNGAATIFTLIALKTVTASVQYPIITGGTIAFSAIVSFFLGEKPTVRTVISVAVAITASVLMAL